MDRRSAVDLQIDADIVNFLQENGIPFTENDIVRPNPIVICKVYEFFLQTFLGITPEAYSQPSLELLGMLEFPEIYTEALSLMTFCGILTKTFDAIYCPGFSLRDITRPESARLRSILSHATNFANFRKQHVEIFEASNQKKDALLDEQKKLEAEQASFAAKLSAVKKERATEEPLIDALKEDLAALTHELKELKKVQTAITSDIDRIKHDRSVLNEKTTAEASYITTLKHDINRIKSKIVDNPERLFQVITELNGTIANEKAALGVLDKKSRDLQLRIDGLAVVEQDLGRSIKMMEDVEVQIKNLAETNTQIASEKEKIEQKQNLLKDLNAQDQHLKRQLSASQDKLSKLQKQQIAKRQMVEEKLNELKKEYEKILMERDEVQAKVDANEKVYKEIVAKTADAKRRFDASLQSVASVFEALRSQVTHYSQEFRRTLETNANLSVL